MDRIEHSVRELGAQELARYGSSVVFTGPPLLTAARSNPLLIIARGEVEVVAADREGGRGKVRYTFRTTRGLGVLVAVYTAMELFARVAGGPQFPRFLFPTSIVFVWALHYIVAWLRVPLLLMRAADGESKPH
jgi:hypothetical protein